MVRFYGAFTANTARCSFPRSLARSLAGEARLHCFGSEFPLQLPPAPSNTSHTHTHSFQAQRGHIHSDHVQHVHRHVGLSLFFSHHAKKTTQFHSPCFLPLTFQLQELFFKAGPTIKEQNFRTIQGMHQKQHNPFIKLSLSSITHSRRIIKI